MTKSARGPRRRIAIGTLLIAFLAAAAVAVFLLDDIGRALGERYHIVGLFPTARELNEGSAVAVAGHEVGQVVEVDVPPEATDTSVHVVAVLELPGRVRPLVRRDSELRLERTTPVQAPVVDITPGTTAAPELRPGDTLRATPRLDREQVMERVRDVARAWARVQASARDVQRTSRTVRPAIDRLDRELAAASAAFDVLAADFERGSLGRLLRDPTWRETLARIRDTSAEIGRALRARTAEMNAIAGEEAQALQAAIDRVARRAGALSARIADLQRRLRLGFPSRLARDTALQAAMREVRAQLDSLVAEMRSNPVRMVF